MNTNVPQKEPFEHWLKRKYGDLELTPRHLEIAKTVYEEEKRAYPEEW